MIIIYITCANLDQAKTIGKHLVEAKLAACANILPNIVSIYEWEGNMTEDNEVILLLKTLPEKFDTIVQKVTDLHSYEVPCIIAMPIQKGNEPYLNWVKTVVL